MKILDTKNFKSVRSNSYNFDFSKNNGWFKRWGKDENNDPQYAPSPEILDLEITTKCNGINGKLCSFCYKSNTPSGSNMNFEIFKRIFDKLPKTICQIAFGVDSECKSNPDTFKIFEYCRKNDVIPNVTVANIDNETAKKLSDLCGAVAVSAYNNVNICYDSVKRLTDLGMKQVNIHRMISKESFYSSIDILTDIKNNSRLEKLNAIVFLSLKKKGRGINHTPLNQEQFKFIVDKAMDKNISFGFDSCGCNKFLKSVENREKFSQLKMMAEPCENSCFSSYINVEGKFFPCSFTEGTDNWIDGLDVLNCNDFLNDIWNNEKTIIFRNNLLKNGRNCPIFEV